MKRATAMRRSRARPPQSAVGRIADCYKALTSSHRRLADFILASPHEAAMMTLEQLAAAGGTSVATANRLGKAIGLSGYPEFKALLRAELQEALRPVEDAVAGLRITRFSRAAVWTQSIEQDIRCIQGITAVGADGAFARSCDLLARQQRVFVVGFGSSAFLAQYASYNLLTLRDGSCAVVDSSGVEGAFRAVQSAGPSDVALHLAFARYSDAATRMAKSLRDKKVPLVTVTDARDAPIASFASESFVVPRQPGFILTGGGAGALAVIDALTRGTAAVIGGSEVQMRAARLTSALGDSVKPPQHLRAR